MSTKKTLTAHDTSALKTMLDEKRDELATLRFQAAHKALRQVHKIKNVKKEIARIITALHAQTN